MKCKLGDNEVELFTIKQVSKVLGVTNEAIRKKEERGQVPAAAFQSSNGARLYSPEEIAMYDYFFKTLWKSRRGVAIPEDVSKAIHKAFGLVRKEVVQKGRVSSSSTLEPVHEIWDKFIPGEAYSHIVHWRSILAGEELDIDNFLDEL